MGFRGSRVELRPLRGLAPLDRLRRTRQIPPSRFVERSRCKHSRVRRAQKVNGLPGSFVARDLQQSLNVLVGRNNVGKTSLLAAIRHALGAGAGRGEALWLTEDDFHRPGPGGFPSMYFSTREAND